MSKKKTTPARQNATAASKATKTSRSKVAKPNAAKKLSGKKVAATASSTTRKKVAAKTATRTTDRVAVADEATTKKAGTKKSSSKSTAAKASTTRRTKQAVTTRAKAGSAKAGKEAMSKEANGQAQTAYGANNRELPLEELRKAKTGLTKKDLANFRQLLLEKRAEIIGDVESLQSDARNSGGGISYEHMADVGTDSYEQEFALGLAESERKILDEIDGALGRMNEGIYGVCVISAQPIGKPRLEIKPWAKYCIEVAREREKRGLMG